MGKEPGGGKRLGFISRSAGGWFLLLLVAGWLAAPLPVLAAGVLSAPEALAKARAGEIVIIDVRTTGEWAQTGVPEGAVQVSLFPEWGVPNETFVDDVLARAGNDRTRPIATICARGNRSSFARDLLTQNGFTSVYSISEGMIGSSFGPGWLARGLPVEPCQGC
ncbi:MAG: rhodanese-like domain-containing protein [Kiloniellales bacterium]